MLSCLQLFETPWTVPHQAPLSMGFPRQEYWSGLPFLPPGDLPDPGNEPMSPGLAGRFFTTEPTVNPFQWPSPCHNSPFSLFRCRWCFTRDTRVTNSRSSDREESWAIPRLQRAMSWSRSLKARGEKPQPWSWQRNEDRPHQLHKSVIINMGKNVSTWQLLCPEMI